MNVIIYSDGASRGNPGPGGYGTRIEYTAPDGTLHVREYSQGYKETTNNRMELMGVIEGFKALIKPCNVTVYTDSQYIARAFNENWIDNWQKKNWKNSNRKPVKNRDLWEELIPLTKVHNCKFIWVKGHDGNPGNERCDELATNAADGDDLLDDPNYEE